MFFCLFCKSDRRENVGNYYSNVFGKDTWMLPARRKQCLQGASPCLSRYPLHKVLAVSSCLEIKAHRLISFQQIKRFRRAISDTFFTPHTALIRYMPLFYPCVHREGMVRTELLTFTAVNALILVILNQALALYDVIDYFQHVFTPLIDLGRCRSA